MYGVPLNEENSCRTVITFFVNRPLWVVGSFSGFRTALKVSLSASTPLLKTSLKPLNTVLIAGRPMRSYWVLPFVLTVEPQMLTLVPTASLSSFSTMALVLRPAKKSTPCPLAQKLRPPVAWMVLLNASRSKKNGSDRGPAKTFWSPPRLTF